MSDIPSIPVLHRGIGAPTKCRSCGASIVFAIAYATGKKMPLQLDSVGEWVIENGNAVHLGPVPVQSDMFAGPGPQRYTSHFAVCPQAEKWRAPR